MNPDAAIVTSKNVQASRAPIPFLSFLFKKHTGTLTLTSENLLFSSDDQRFGFALPIHSIKKMSAYGEYPFMVFKSNHGKYGLYFFAPGELKNNFITILFQVLRPRLVSRFFGTVNIDQYLSGAQIQADLGRQTAQNGSYSIWKIILYKAGVPIKSPELSAFMYSWAISFGIIDGLVLVMVLNMLFNPSSLPDTMNKGAIPLLAVSLIAVMAGITYGVSPWSIFKKKK